MNIAMLARQLEMPEQLIPKNPSVTQKADASLVARLRRRIVELEQMVHTDELTGLLNRRGFDRQLQRTLSSASRYDENGVLIYIDLDGFKSVNDSHGHAAGDKVLGTVAKQLSENIRDTDFAGRLGGDEFAVLLTRTSWPNGRFRANILGTQLNQTLVNWRGSTMTVSASLGVQNYDSRDAGFDLLNKADKAMYENKRRRGGGDDSQILTPFDL